MPREQGPSEQTKITVFNVGELPFNHVLYVHPQAVTGEELGKVLKLAIDDILSIEEGLKKEIGYNLIITKEFTMVTALVEPYRVYGTHLLYFDPLAYLGYVNVAKVVEGYALKPERI